jgi:hypothetical protein
MVGSPSEEVGDNGSHEIQTDASWFWGSALPREEAWAALRKLEHGFPSVVIVPNAFGTRSRRRGHFAPHTWRARQGGAHEVAISPDLTLLRDGTPLGHPTSCFRASVATPAGLLVENFVPLGVSPKKYAV